MLLRALEKSLGSEFGEAEKNAWEHFLLDVFMAGVEAAYEKEEQNEKTIII